jgi:hypothetical protein
MEVFQGFVPVAGRGLQGHWRRDPLLNIALHLFFMFSVPCCLSFEAAVVAIGQAHNIKLPSRIYLLLRSTGLLVSGRQAQDPGQAWDAEAWYQVTDAADALMLTFYNDYSILMSSSSSKVVVPQDEGNFDRFSPVSQI